jgi:4-hydroxymandelate oxidase
VNRRQNLKTLAALAAASQFSKGQEDPVRDHTRVPAMSELRTAFDFEEVAWRKQSRAAYDYMAYGTDGEFTLRRNRDAFDWVELAPVTLAGADAIRTDLQLFGTKMSYPILVSPTAGHSQFHPEGELATHRGAEAASNTPMVVSNNSTYPFEKVAAAAKSPVWVQLYPKQQLDANRQYLENAQAAGALAVVVTIDQQAASYERSLHDRNLSISTPARRVAARAPGAQYAYGVSPFRLWYEWKFFDQIRPFVKVPMLAKGILTAEDAKLALEHGVDGIYVSNHGGRSLDYDPSTLEVLPEIVDAVGGRVPVLFDSGIRRGLDVLKALSLGASAVCAGRVPLWGLASYGPAGVQRVLEILQTELVEAMRSTGCAALNQINRKMAIANFT